MGGRRPGQAPPSWEPGASGAPCPRLPTSEHAVGGRSAKPVGEGDLLPLCGKGASLWVSADPPGLGQM